MTNAQVAVRGSATLEVDPETATVHINVSSRDRDRTKALRLLTESLSEVQHLLTGYADAVEKTDNRAVNIHPEFEADKHGKNRRVSAYNGSVTLAVTVTDFTVLGDMVLRLGQHEAVTLSGPYWNLRHDSPVYRQARIEAVREARVRASEYAEAAGGRLTGLVEVTDLGLSGGSDSVWAGSAPDAPGAFYARGAAVANEMTLDLSPVRQKASASVQARFLMSQPDFS